jgi:hypothetical protein
MKVFFFRSLTLLLMLSCNGCGKPELFFETGDLAIEITTGEHYIHDFPVALGIKLKNPPQMVIWAEDTAGNYITTLFCTYKSATCNWQKSMGEDVPDDGIKRPSALPYWSHKWFNALQQKQTKSLDAFTGATSIINTMPSKNNQLVDGITGATPKAGYTTKVHPKTEMEIYCILFEVNQSTDFNDAFPKDAEISADNYSGGELGSGQPALVYKAIIDMNSTQSLYTMELIGHSSPDGDNGELYDDLNGLTSALAIIKDIKIKVQ